MVWRLDFGAISSLCLCRLPREANDHSFFGLLYRVCFAILEIALRTCDIATCGLRDLTFSRGEDSPAPAAPAVRGPGRLAVLGYLRERVGHPAVVLGQACYLRRELLHLPLQGCGSLCVLRQLRLQGLDLFSLPPPLRGVLQGQHLQGFGQLPFKFGQ